MRPLLAAVGFALSASVLLMSGCGGGSSNSPAVMQPPPPPSPPPPPPPPTLDPQYRASAHSPFALNCEGAAISGTVYTNAEVEPSLAINPANTHNLIGVWQQDRWSTGGARGIVAGASLDGGVTWTQHTLPFTRCAGGNAANGGDYERASDPWVTIAADGAAYQIALAFNGSVLQPNSVSAVVVSRSSDGGMTWGPTTTLIRDVTNFFNDKCSITADSANPRFVYAVWDRPQSTTEAPTYFARSSDSGASWEMPRPIYNPGTRTQTINNIVVVLPNGTLVNFFVQILNGANGNAVSSTLAVIRSTDNGVTWSAAVKIADDLSIGTRDPDTNTPVRDSTITPSIAVGPGGSLLAAWQDARFSSGARDGIALARSDDGGMTWSAPTRVNGDASVAAFSPSVHVRGDGTVGVSYYDFRANTTDKATLYTEYWLARSGNAANWQENQIAGPFDLALAPRSSADNTSGYFLGDYQALASVGNVFVPFFVQTNLGDVNNRTDVFAAPAVSVASTAAQQKALSTAPANAMDVFRASPQWQQRVQENLARSLAWRRRGGREALQPGQGIP